MKEINELILPDDVRYSKDHEWARVEGANIRAGISDYAQDQLGDIVFVEMPKVGKKFAQGEVFGSVESVKAVSEVFMPVGGEIIEINDTLSALPQLVNEDPYHNWIVLIKPDDPSQMDALLNRDDYLNLLKGL